MSARIFTPEEIKLIETISNFAVAGDITIFSAVAAAYEEGIKKERKRLRMVLLKHLGNFPN